MLYYIVTQSPKTVQTRFIIIYYPYIHPCIQTQLNATIRYVSKRRIFSNDVIVTASGIFDACANKKLDKK